MTEASSGIRNAFALAVSSRAASTRSGLHGYPTRTSSSTFRRVFAAKSGPRALGGGRSFRAQARPTNTLLLAASGLLRAAWSVLPPTDLVQLVAVTYVGFVIAQVCVVFGTGAAARQLLHWPVFLTITALWSLAVADYRRGSDRR